MSLFRLFPLSVAFITATSFGFLLPAPPAGAATYVGNQPCTECHQQAIDDWTGSHHDLAMQEATADTVLGDFDDARVNFSGVNTHFYKKNEEFWVKTDSADGDLRDFPVRYVFGVYPLQQLLLPLDSGRLQAFTIAWDSRPKEKGGQRWYHLFPEDTPAAGDPLHWTGPYHNWNTRCAECHSTDVHKNYDAATRSFNTRYEQIDVGCEACHGPASDHVEAAHQQRLQALTYSGFAMSLAARGEWRFDNGAAIARRHTTATEALGTADAAAAATQSADNNVHNSDNGKAADSHRLPLASQPTAGNQQIDNCGRCHARRSTLGDYHYGADLLDTHRLALIEPGLYWPDGQIRDEVYVYGSFVQSKMHQAGVVCSNCHNPHSGELRAQGNAVCSQCHQPAVYDVSTHHRHTEGAGGSLCVDCHMPEQVYMGVDARRDHSMRIPRPDISMLTGSPNACTQCHTEKSDSWASDALRSWGVKPKRQARDRARAFHAAANGDIRSLPTLKAIIDDTDATGLLRASALNHYGQLAPPDLAQTSAMLLNSSDSKIRLSAVRATSALPARQRFLMLRGLIGDPVLAVRMATAEQLADAPMNELRSKDIEQLQPLFDEYVAVQSKHLDMPSIQLQLANFYRSRNDTGLAERHLREAILLNRLLEPAVINLVDLLRVSGREVEARALLKDTLEHSPDAGALHHALGLLEIRSGNAEAAMTHLKTAAELETGGSRHRYVYAVALHDTGKPREALELLERLNLEQPGHPETLYALIGYAQELGAADKVGRYQAQLQGVAQAAGLR